MAEEQRDPVERLLAVGINPRSAAGALRDRLLIEDAQRPALLSDIKALGLAETLVLTTCDRLEVVALDDDKGSACVRILAFLAERAGIAMADLESQSFQIGGTAAARHLFAVAASLESQVVGEPQVLGQVKDCHRDAAKAGTLGAELEGLLQAAYAAAKRVRSQTTLAQRPVSMAASALMIARNLHGDLTRSHVALVGLGEMAELMALEFKEASIGGLTVLHGSTPRAEAAARRLLGHFRPWGDLDAALAESDIVVTAVGSGRHCVAARMVKAALKQRRQRPILIFDCAVPADVDPAVDGLDSAFLYSLADLERVALEGMASRESQAAAAWAVLDEELDSFLTARAARAAGPSVSSLRRHFEAARAEVLAKGGLNAEEATRLLINRLLHGPIEALRDSASEATGRHEDLARSIDTLFGGEQDRKKR